MPRKPTLKEQFSFADQNRSSQCCHCGSQPQDPSALIAIKNERASFIWAVHGILTHPEADRMCPACYAKDLKDLDFTVF